MYSKAAGNVESDIGRQSYLVTTQAGGPASAHRCRVDQLELVPRGQCKEGGNLPNWTQVGYRSWLGDATGRSRLYTLMNCKREKKITSIDKKCHHLTLMQVPGYCLSAFGLVQTEPIASTVQR